MTNLAQHQSWTRNLFLRPATAALVIAIEFALMTAYSAQAQTLTALHSFTGGLDGEAPYAGLAMDRAGNLYGTAPYGGNRNSNCYGSCGTVFRLTRTNFGWVFAPLYDFLGGTDGSDPTAVVTIGPDGNVYGTTAMGGGGCTSDYGCGTVFKLTPPPTTCHFAICPWTETVLYRFADNPEGGAIPYWGVIFDSQGNLYGAAAVGGTGGAGTVYELSPSGGGWIAKTLYNFQGGIDGAIPLTNLTMDRTGTLYGTTEFGGTTGNGNVFRLVRNGASWTEESIYSFLGGVNGMAPQGGVILDSAGNLYGGTVGGGTIGGGVAYELSPTSDGSWTYTILSNFNGSINSNLSFDAAGNLYGTTYAGGAHDDGLVFKLSYSGGVWTQSMLGSFSGLNGALPIGDVLVAPDGNFYGTATFGGKYGYGVVWEITP